MRGGRVALLPPTLLGATAVVVGVAARASPPGAALPGRLVGCALVCLVLAGAWVPGAALALTGTSGETPAGASAAPVGEGAVDVARVAADVRSAHELVLVWTVTVALLLAVGAPVVVALGPAGALLGLDAAVVVALRARRHRDARLALAGLVAGLSGMVAIALAVLVGRPGWRPELALGALAAAVVLVTVAPAETVPQRARLDRLAELVESAAVLALMPLLLLASGVVGVVTRVLPP
jgi:hypothetical protein